MVIVESINDALFNALTISLWMESLALWASQEAVVSVKTLAGFHIEFGSSWTVPAVDNLQTHVVVGVDEELVVLIL